MNKIDSFNPFFIRASVYCTASSPARPLRTRSFNPFFIRASVYWSAIGAPTSSIRPRFNPFFIRASVYWNTGPTSRKTPRLRFNPFFIRASVYCMANVTHIADNAPVSIPSSSGHQFTGNSLGTAWSACFQAFQSLLHQGISLLQNLNVWIEYFQMAFQSLLHQGISLLHFAGFLVENPSVMVSIPSSSGHQFTVRSPKPSRRSKISWFQSLLHQGISLLRLDARRPYDGLEIVSIPSSSGHQFTEFAPLGPGGQRFVVSIPSSSGHQFTGYHPSPERAAHVPFQSLLHQGISLLFHRDLRRGFRMPEFQSLLHQGISLLISIVALLVSLINLFQSLLHQGISLLNDRAYFFWGQI